MNKWDQCWSCEEGFNLWKYRDSRVRISKLSQQSKILKSFFYYVRWPELSGSYKMLLFSGHIDKIFVDKSKYRYDYVFKNIFLIVIKSIYFIAQI